jgi:hypothetical protein
MTFPTRLSVTVTIGGVDVTAKIRPGTLNISNVLTQQIDTLSATIDGAKLLNLSDWQEVIVLDGTTRIFGGFLLNNKKAEGANLDTDFNIAASDYSVRLNKVYIKEEYVNTSDADIISDIFTTYLSGEGYDVSTYVTELYTHPSMRFNRVTVLDVIKRLAKLAKADWYVDYDKKLHFFPSGTAGSAAPFGLSDTPNFSTTYPYHDLVIDEDGSGVVNRVEIVGGNYRSDDTTFYLAGTGQDNRISVPFKLHAPTGQTSIQVWRNDGTLASPVWTALTVKVGYVDDLVSATDVLYYFNEKVLEQTANWPNLANAVKVTAKYEVPLRTRVQDQASYNHYGMYFDDVIVNTSIIDKAVARLAGLAELAEKSLAKTSISLEVDQPGIRAGQIVHFVSALHSKDADYIVQRVTCKVGVNGRAFYKVSLGTYNTGLIDMLLSIAKSTKGEVAWSDEEVLDEVLQVAESISLTESVSVATSTNPYYFSETLADAFIWGFGTFDP